MATTYISDEEYKAWLTPQSALKRLNFSEATSRVFLGSRIESGVIRVACKRFSSERNEDFAVVHPDYWSGHNWISDDHFWTTGDAAFYNSSHDEFGGPLHHHAFLVRLEPSALQEFGPSVEWPSSRETDARKTPLARSELTKFGALLRSVYPDATEALATRIVKAMFPDSAISREQIREILPPRRPGRPASSDKDRE